MTTSTRLYPVLTIIYSLCAVDVCDETEAEESGYYTFKLHARKNTISLSAKTMDEVNEWVGTLQDVIDNCPTIQTITERVILEIIVSTVCWYIHMYMRTNISPWHVHSKVW